MDQLQCHNLLFQKQRANAEKSKSMQALQAVGKIAQPAIGDIIQPR
jgi:hypothetical protein